MARKTNRREFVQVAGLAASGFMATARPQAAAIPEPQAGAMSAENKAVIRRWMEAVNRRDLEEAAQLMDANYLRHLPGLESRGPEGFKQVATAFLTGFPDSTFTTEDLIAEGDRVVIRFTVRGTHLGDFAGIPPTNRQITLSVIMVNRISNGKMIESWEVLDQLGLFQALGSFPPAPTA